MEVVLLRRNIVLDLLRDLSKALYGFVLEKLSYILSTGPSRGPQGYRPKGLGTELWPWDVTAGT